MKTLYTVTAIIEKAVYYQRMAYQVPVQLIYLGNRKVNKATLCYYYRKYHILLRDEASFVDDYMNEHFTSQELHELISSDFLKRFASYEIHEVDVEEMETSITFDDILGFDEDDAKVVARMNQCTLPLSVMSGSGGFTQGKNVQYFNDIASFPVGMYYNVDAAQAIV